MAGSITVFGGTGFIGRHLVPLTGPKWRGGALGRTPSRPCSDDD
jgi:nucleoside-diphosphate-sugar epimerase